MLKSFLRRNTYNIQTKFLNTLFLRSVFTGSTTGFKLPLPPEFSQIEDAIEVFKPSEQPASISYFTAKPHYNDLLIYLDELFEKYRNAPKLKRDKNSPTLWILKDHLSSQLGLKLKSTQYRNITRKLNRLDIVVPETAPKLHDFLELFRRIDLEKKKKELEANKTPNRYGVSYAVGKRKEAAAQVWIVEGDGKVFINSVPVADYFSLLKDRETVLYPLNLVDSLNKYNVWAKVKGGGTSGQAGAIAHGITKNLIIHEPSLKPALRKAKLVTRDIRSVERKKPGLAKARKRYTWVKR
ncbi:ribosomal protein S5 domain 2-type protein [Gigaspora rosea]|uniref:Small ribosomal subunit protein uS9m n=1 Tax=Gigaspora rosea TaxID=44941 RepID=A0A397UJX5_9GLOM|nr:ribosomal protein S5 domain 2-type protein [Gigaspora rosea]